MIQTLRTAFAAALLCSFTPAQDATVSVLHGIPGLSQPVDVFANGNRLFSFDYGDLAGPLRVPPGVINLEVRLNGNTILQAAPDLQADTNYTVVAHLLQGGGNTLSAFVNDVSRIQGIGEYFATVAFRHVADAPAVDVYVDRYGREVLVYSDVASGDEGRGWQQAPAYLLGGLQSVRLTPTGSNQTAFGPDPVGNLESGNFYSVFAIGDLAQGSFRLVVQTIESTPNLPQLRTLVRGTSCGGQISLSTTNVQFDQDFDVLVAGGSPGAFGVLLIGFSDQSFLGRSLPFDLSRLGAPGCSLYQDAVGAVSVDLDANGGASVTESIPAELARFVTLGGVHFQYALLNRGANALGVQFTDYASILAN